MATILTTKQVKKCKRRIKELNKELKKAKADRQGEIDLSEETRATCQKIVDDPATNEVRREYWTENVQDAESLIKYSKRKQECIEEELQDLVALLQGMEELKQPGSGSGVQSLKECCLSVIMPALMQQKALEPHQLQARLSDHLPDYLPAKVKSAIADKFRAHMHPAIKYLL